MIEKAIENNYPLPGYIFGASQESQRVNSAPTPPPFNSGDGNVAPEGVPSDQAAGFQARPYQQAPVGQQRPVSDQIDWHQMKGGFSLAVTGFALMMFFAVVHATPLACIFSIMLLMGLGKMWLNYQDQKNAINSWRQQQAWYGTQPHQEQPRAAEQPQQ
ncbi:MAG: hypothetical protein IJ775_04745 [Muribaculaceae bacterium]|nr:hypothetical protein [Muribaculaceae bacterium]